MSSPNLAIPHIAAGQNQKEVTANDAFNKIDGRITSTLGKSWQTGDGLTWTLTTAEFQSNARFFADGTPDGDITLSIPAVRAPFLCRNATSFNMLVTTGSGTETVTLAPGDHALIYATGQNTLYAVGQTGDAASALADLTDVSAPSLVNGDFLRFDGTNWANQSAGIYSRTLLPFKGVLLRRSTNYVIPSSGAYTAIPWETASYDTDSFWDGGSPSRLTVPAGVTRVRLMANLEWQTSPTNQLIEIRKNGASVLGGGSFIVRGDSGYSNQMRNITSAVMEVAAGDYFELMVYVGSSAEVKNLDRTWICLEVVETTDQQAPSLDIGFTKTSTPSAGETLHSQIFTRAAVLPVGLTGSQAYADVTATAATSLDLQKNGVSFGSIDFAIGSNVGGFTNVSEVSFAAGDRLSVIAPNPADATLADLTIAMSATLGS
ncbi:hypothetical protein [Pseudemcibacter aquimaris]|uniref:hypothetical protein n=1 Tax=Pseudemcibacter aquimaris TaxID=2857064 RepID=UPI0020131CBB|nr:hypothetical protein [Pseudemcibacter aquimaris]MCC3862537.1 hypothetical protein [Pseudemcibacter aquimaris]WDU57800.1 hypothetical protein KW060_11390 [Pseudemcibacter aquimaris]